MRPETVPVNLSNIPRASVQRRRGKNPWGVESNMEKMLWKVTVITQREGNEWKATVIYYKEGGECTCVGGWR